MFLLAITTSTLNAMAASVAVAIAAAVLSVFVVLRQWSYLGDGISHAGYGGIGTAVLLSIAIPSLNNESSIYAVAATFSLATAFAVAWISRRRAVSGDAAIGIFVAATLAWGFIAFGIHDHLGRGNGSGWENYLLGDVRRISTAQTELAVSVSIGIVLIVLLLNRQIVLYCFDPVLAEVTGVPAGFVHYVLMLLVGLIIIVGMRLAGNLLFPAMLVLPGAAGLTVSRQMKKVMQVAISVSVVATIIGLIVTKHWTFILPGPAMVMVLFFEFLIAYAFRWRVGSEGN